MMRKALYIFILFILMAACSPVRVIDTESEAGFRLNNYKTFDFYEVDVSGTVLKPYESQLEYLKEQITQQLEQRGLQRSTASPDLKINLGVVVAEKVQTRETNILTDPPFYVGQRRYSWKSREVEVGRYQQGTLSLHLVDNARNELVWQGAAQSIVPEDNTPKLRERVKEGVEKLVKEIP